MPLVEVVHSAERRVFVGHIFAMSVNLPQFVKVSGSWPPLPSKSIRLCKKMNVCVADHFISLNFIFLFTVFILNCMHKLTLGIRTVWSWP